MTSALSLTADTGTTSSDDADVLAAVAGDERAFDRLYPRYVPALRARPRSRPVPRSQ